MLVRIPATINLLVAEFLLRVGANRLQPRNPIDYIDSQREPIDFVFNRQFQRRVDIAALLVTAHVQIFVIVPLVSEPVNQPRIAVKVENDWLVRRKETVKVPVAQAMRMLAIRLQLEQIDYVDKT